MKNIDEFSGEILYNIDKQCIMITIKTFNFIYLPLLVNNNEKIKLNKIHAIIFDYVNGEDLYIKNDNLSNFIIDLNNINSYINFFLSNDYDYTINKFDFTLNNIDFFYDDDSYLLILIPLKFKYKTVEFIQKIINSLPDSDI